MINYIDNLISEFIHFIFLRSHFPFENSQFVSDVRVLVGRNSLRFRDLEPLLKMTVLFVQLVDRDVLLAAFRFVMRQILHFFLQPSQIFFQMKLFLFL